MMRVLAVDDGPAALQELCGRLRAASDDVEVTGVADAISVVKLVHSGNYDAVFLDIALPGLGGMELAGFLAKLAEPPAIVFVTACDGHAAAAYGIGAVDYLLKPVRVERLAKTLARVRRVVPRADRATAAANGAEVPDAMAALPVESRGRTWYVRRSDVRFVEARGDYVRLHTPSGRHLVRMPISRLQEYWQPARFVRSHRGYLVSLPAIRELRSDSTGGLLAHTDVGDVPVSRRHAREVREQLLRAAQRDELAGAE